METSGGFELARLELESDFFYLCKFVRGLLGWLKATPHTFTVRHGYIDVLDASFHYLRGFKKVERIFILFEHVVGSSYTL